MVAADIPSLGASKITSGTFDVARIPNLAASKITSGVLAIANGGTGINNFGTITTYDSDSKNVANGTTTNMTNFTLAAGTYLVIIHARFQSNPTGRRVVGLSTTAGEMPSTINGRTMVTSVSGAGVDITFPSFVSPSTSTKYYVVFQQYSGEALSCRGYATVLRIK